MKRNLLSWASTLMLLLFVSSFAQETYAQKNKVGNDFRFKIKASKKLLNGDKVEDGLVALQFSITNIKQDLDLQNDNLDNIYFEIPKGAGLISPIGFYKSDRGKRYKVINVKEEDRQTLPNGFNGFASQIVKFEAIGGAKSKSNKKLKEDDFELLLSEVEYSKMTTIHVAAEASKGVNENVKRTGFVSFNVNTDGKITNENKIIVGAASKTTVSPLACSTLPAISSSNDQYCPGEIVKFTLPVQGVIYNTVEWVIPALGSDGLPSNWEKVDKPGTPKNEVWVKIGDIPVTIYARVTTSGCNTVQVVSKPTHLGDEIPVTLTVANGDKDGTAEEEFKKGDFLIFNAAFVESREKQDYKYTWYYPEDWEVFSGLGTSQLILIAGESEGSVIVNVSSIREEEPRICGLGYDYVELIKEGGTCAGPPIEVVTPPTICENGVYKISVKNPDPAKQIKYIFSVPDGVEIVSQGYDYAYVRVFKVTPGTTELAFTIIAVNANNCGATDVCVKIPVGDCPDTACETLTPPSLIVPSQLCNIRNFEFTLTGMQDGVTYDFEFPEGFVIDSFDPETGKLSVDIVFDENTMLPTQQTLVVIATNECGESVAYEREVTVSDCEGGNPLPVTLTRFEGASRSGSVELAWSTASEINNDRFEIERSANGKEFKKVGEVKGNGNSVVLVDYTYTDRSAASGTVYYRLKQVDFDGQSEYSKVIAVTHAASASNATLSVYPNPVENGKVNLRFQEQVDGTTTIRLTDMSGRVLHTQEARNVGAEHELNLTGLNLKAGIYMISVTANGQSTTQRIMVR